MHWLAAIIILEISWNKYLFYYIILYLEAVNSSEVLSILMSLCCKIKIELFELIHKNYRCLWSTRYFDKMLNISVYTAIYCFFMPKIWNLVLLGLKKHSSLSLSIITLLCIITQKSHSICDLVLLINLSYLSYPLLIQPLITIILLSTLWHNFLGSLSRQDYIELVYMFIGHFTKHGQIPSSMYVVENSRIPFLWLNNIYTGVCITIS